MWWAIWSHLGLVQHRPQRPWISRKRRMKVSRSSPSRRDGSKRMKKLPVAARIALSSFSLSSVTRWWIERPHQAMSAGSGRSSMRGDEVFVVEVDFVRHSRRAWPRQARSPVPTGRSRGSGRLSFPRRAWVIRLASPQAISRNANGSDRAVRASWSTLPAALCDRHVRVDQLLVGCPLLLELFERAGVDHGPAGLELMDVDIDHSEHPRCIAGTE